MSTSSPAWRSPIVPATVIAGGGLAAAVAWSPVTAALVVLSGAALTILTRVAGWRDALWYLFLLTLALREPLSVDVVGERTIYFSDLLLAFLTIIVFYEHGFREIWRQSFVWRLGMVLLFLTALNFYSTVLLFWEIAHTANTILQILTFYVAWHLIRTGEQARRALFAVVLGIIPAALVGFYQSTLTLAEFHTATWSVPAVAWDSEGVPKIRAFSTFDHPLKFAFALSVGFSLALGLVWRARSAGVVAVVVGCAALFLSANQFTYSMGGVVGSLVGLAVAVILWRPQLVLVAVPAFLVLWVVAAPEPLQRRVVGVLTGEHTSFGARAISYVQAVNIIRENPVLGVGWGGMREQFQNKHRISRHRAVAFTSENYFLERTAVFGFGGLAVVLLAMFRFFRNARARPPDGASPGRWPREALLIAGAAYYVQAQTQPTADPTGRYLLWLLFAVAERMHIAFTSGGGEDASDAASDAEQTA